MFLQSHRIKIRMFSQEIRKRAELVATSVPSFIHLGLSLVGWQAGGRAGQTTDSVTSAGGGGNEICVLSLKRANNKGDSN